MSNDSLVLEARHVPASSIVLFVQGSTTVSGPNFGDGRLCIAGPLTRLAVAAAQFGSASFPSTGQQSVSVVGGLPAAGGVRAYQAYYRDSANFCTSATFNLTSAFQLDWTP